MNKALQVILAIVIAVLVFWLCEGFFVFAALIGLVYIIFTMITNKGKLDLDKL